MATLPRVTLDLKIPMWGLMSVLGAGLLVATTMYFQLVRVAEDLIELKAAFKASTSQTIQFAQEQALLKFRIEKLEDGKR